MANVMSSEEVMKIGLRGYKEETDYNWHGKMIKIRYMLTRDEELELIHSILKCCTSDGGEEYVVPELVDLALRVGIVASYAFIELPENIDKQHKLLYYSDIYDVVLKNANAAQTDNIIRSVRSYA